MTATPVEPINLFTFLELLAIAQGRKIVPAQRAAIATFIALDGKGTTGTNCGVDVDRIAAEIGLSGRQVWRHVHQLVDDGWLEQTTKAAPGGRNRPGRRARYRLTHPRLQVTHERLTEPDDTMSHDRMPEPGAERHTINADDTPENVTRDPETDPERLTLSDQSNDIATPGDGTVPPCNPPTYTSGPVSTQPKVAREDADHQAGAAAARRALQGRTR